LVTPVINGASASAPGPGIRQRAIGFRLAPASVERKQHRCRSRVRATELESVIGEYAAIFDAPGVLDGMQLQGTESATTVRVDAKEFIGGFYLLEVDNLDAATALASRVPAARMGGAVEVRPIAER
jgi:hypothetical protein